MSFYPLVIGIVLLLSPLTASAKQETVWNFQKGIPGTWHIDGCTSAKQTSDGFSIVTGASRCSVQRKISDFRHPIDTLSFTVLSPVRTEYIFLWHRRDSPSNHLVELPLVLRSSDIPQTIDFNLSAYSQWDRRTDRIGFAFPPNTLIIFQNITFIQWSLREKAGAAFQSFWTFDTFRPYAINFLWGPIIGWNPVWQEQLFLKIPPRGWSMNRLFAWLLLPLGLCCLFLYWRQEYRHCDPRPLLIFGSVFVSLWLLSDLRMGLELLHYIRTDWQTYVLRPPGTRTFRVFGDFPDIIDAVTPVLSSAERYGFAGPPGTPFGSFLRYRTYPSLLVDAEWPEEERNGIRHWFIILRPDTSLSPQGELFLGKERLSPPGTILENFQNNAILFEVGDGKEAPHPPPDPK